MIYFILSFILDIVLNNSILSCYGNLNYFFPNILVSSIPLVYFLVKNKKFFFFIIIIFGLLYDFIYSDIFLINTYFFLLFGLFINTFYKSFDFSYFNISIISILGFLFYDIFIFFILVLLGSYNFDIYDLIYKLIRSFLLNIIYIFISIFILSRIFGFRFKKKRY